MKCSSILLVNLLPVFIDILICLPNAFLHLFYLFSIFSAGNLIFVTPLLHPFGDFLANGRR